MHTKLEMKQPLQYLIAELRIEILQLLNNYQNYEVTHGRVFMSDEFLHLLESNPLFEFEQPVSVYEKLLILFALVPHIQPKFFDSLIQELYPQGGEFPEFGGVKTGNNRGMVPTGETALFILAGNDMEERLKIQELFSDYGQLFKQNILWLEHVKEGEPAMSGRMIISHEWIDKLLFGKISKPKFSPDFPAKLISTKMEWNDLVLHEQTADQINDIKIWLEYNKELSNDPNIARKIKPGYRALFYGPPGTGKTLTASLLGKQFDKDVYRVDLSQVISKYIGETEKNLEKIFTRAEHKNWILFFDEGDALFGKRTNVQSSIDKHANQEVSYLLQRVEDFPGLMILASNYKSNLDAAFLRRFNALIYFPMPDAGERLELWKKSLPSNILIDEAADFKKFADQYELSGSSILNVMHYASLKAIANQSYIIRHSDIIDGIRRELLKEEKSI